MIKLYYLESEAIFSPDRKYRYKLSRTWDDDEPKVAFIMLNPSVADENANDPTVSRCVRYAMDWGYGTLIVGNLFAIVSTDPKEIWKNEIGHDPVGPENDRYLMEINTEADLTVVAWGNHGVYNNRGKQVLKILSNPHCLEMNRVTGEPAHPLYMPKDMKPKPLVSEI